MRTRGTASPAAILSSAMHSLPRSKILGSVGPGTGWTPAPILIEDDGAHMVAAAPAYLKAHSQGEYVFDHGWAEAWERAGGEYYPKLQVAVPFTPVPGLRLLGSRPQHLLAAIEGVTAQYEMSSAHITFIDEAARPKASAADGSSARESSITGSIAATRALTTSSRALTSRKRKAIRKDAPRRRNGLRFRRCAAARSAGRMGCDLDFYQDTGSRKWGHPYLTREFFDLVGKTMGDELLLFLAYREGSRSRARSTSSGRTRSTGVIGVHRRGAVPPLRALLLSGDRVGDRSWSRCVQAGAQGEHKLARGYEPVITRSAHFIPNPAFARRSPSFSAANAPRSRPELEWLREGLPYRSSSPE